VTRHKARYQKRWDKNRTVTMDSPIKRRSKNQLQIKV
jgi:hypothetical protein